MQILPEDKKKTTSRRSLAYNNDDSTDTEEENEAGSWIVRSMSEINLETERTLKPNIYFKQYRHQLNSLLKRKTIKTAYPIVSLMITHDSARVVTVTKKNERTFFVKTFSLDTHEQIFEEMVGGGETQYVKVKEVEQNEESDKFAYVYFDDGKFRLRYFARDDPKMYLLYSNVKAR